MTEEAKAVQEVAKTTGKALDIARDVGAFFAKAMGESVDATAGMLADTLKYKRWERQIRLVQKAQGLLMDKGLDNRYRVIPPKLALPILQNASFEDDDFMHTMWARLLARSMDPNEPHTRSSYTEILKQLEPSDVLLLDTMHRKYIEELERRRGFPLHNIDTLQRKRPPSEIGVSTYAIVKEMQLDMEDYWASIDNLRRLGLCDSYVDHDSIEAEVDGDSNYHDVVSYHGGYDKLYITALGAGLVRICTYGGSLPEPEREPDA